ncbi:MAG: hypothetical protein ACYDHY_12465 [Acidiferrobacterales bacterium]
METLASDMGGLVTRRENFDANGRAVMHSSEHACALPWWGVPWQGSDANDGTHIELQVARQTNAVFHFCPLVAAPASGDWSQRHYIPKNHHPDELSETYCPVMYVAHIHRSMAYRGSRAGQLSDV